MDMEEVKRLIHYARKDKNFYQRLVSDPKTTIRNLERKKLSGGGRKSKYTNQNPSISQGPCGGTCGAVSCRRPTCGAQSCVVTCAASCRTITCRRSCGGNTCGSSCPRTVGIILRPISSTKKPKR